MKRFHGLDLSCIALDVPSESITYYVVLPIIDKYDGVIMLKVPVQKSPVQYVTSTESPFPPLGVGRSSVPRPGSGSGVCRAVMVHVR